MPLDLATTLAIRDRRTDGPASLVDVAAVVGSWAGLPEPESAIEPGRWEGIGPKAAKVRVDRLDPGPGQEWAWHLELSHPDERDSTIWWEVEVEAAEPAEGEAGETSVSVTLARTSVDSRVVMVRTDPPAPPRVIRDLVEAPHLECFDGPIPLTSGPSELTRLGVDGFVQEVLLQHARRLPVVGVSVLAATGQPIVDIERVARELAGMAHVWLIPPGVTWALEARLPERLGVYNGAVRIWWPGLDEGSNPYDHHLWLPDGGDPRRDVFAVVARSALGRFVPLGALARLQRQERDRERQQHARELERLRQQLAERTVGAATVESEELLEALDRRVKEQQEYEELLHAEIEQLEGEIRRLGEERDRERNRAQALQAQLEQLRRSAREVVDLDPSAAAFLDEVRAAYERRYTESDQREWPLKEIRLHRDFLASLDALQGISRDKVLEVCADVGTGRVHSIPARETHMLKKGEGPGPVRVRSRDGAQAWRCYLQQRTPQARRLHWWALPGGGVELAHVGNHDDYTCPE